jgi:cytochrome o ubiquinol oxidase subunit 2
MKWNFLLPILAGVLICGIVGWAAMHNAGMPVLHPHGIVALQERNIMFITVLLSAIVVVPVFLLLFYFAWRYRAGSVHTELRHAPNWDHDSWQAEFVWWLAPLMIIAILAVITWKSSHDLDPYKALSSTVAPITIDVVALDWKWLFIYPEQGIATVNYLEIPVNTPVHFQITSNAPMNSFWIPSLGGQIMAMPGMQTQLNLVANSTGTFNGSSANISGRGFAGMTFLVHAVSSDDFSNWTSNIQKQAHPLDAGTYAELSKPSQYVPPLYYSSVEEGLYTGSIMKTLMPSM